MRSAGLILTVVVAVVGSALGAAAQSTDSPSAETTEVGVTSKEIRIAVIADVDNAAVPGLFVGVPNAVKGFAKYINNSCRPKNTCLAGRKVVVDFIDSHLSNTDARNAVITACSRDFAIVGTAALFLNNVDDMVACEDRSGAPTGIPDLPALTTEVAQQCSPVSYPINPSQLDCTTKDEHPQTWRVNRGAVRYYSRTRSKDLHGIFVYGNDLKSASIATLVVARGDQAGGVESDGEIGISSLAPQSAFTPVVQKMKTEKSNYALNAGTFSTGIALRKEAKLQGLDPKEIVWDCFSNCYDKRLIEQGGADVEGQYVTLTHLPFTETKSNKALKNYVKFTGKDKIDGLGVYAWVATLLFRDAVNAIVEKGGNNALTRKALLDELATISSFDADGMWGATNVAERVPSPCFLVLQVKDGEFVRVYPKKPGTLDCKSSNAIRIKEDLLD